MGKGSEQTCLHLKNESGHTMAPQFDLKIVWRAFTQEPHQELSYHFTKYSTSEFRLDNMITPLPKQQEGKDGNEEDQMETVSNQPSVSTEQRTQLVLASLWWQHQPAAEPRHKLKSQFLPLYLINIWDIKYNWKGWSTECTTERTDCWKELHPNSKEDRSGNKLQTPWK